MVQKENDKAAIVYLLEKYEDDNEMLTFVKSFVNSQKMMNGTIKNGKYNPKHIKTLEKPINNIERKEKKTLYIIGAEIEAKSGFYSVIAPKFIYLDKKEAMAKLDSLLSEEHKGKVFLFTVKEGEEIRPIAM